MRRWTLTRRVTVLVSAVVVGVLTSLVVLIVVMNRNADFVDDLIERTGTVRRSAVELYASVLNQQNAVRGYALTGHPEQRDSYFAAREQQERLVAAVREMGGEPEVDQVLDQLTQDSLRWRELGAEPLLAAVAEGRPPSASVLDIEERLFEPVLRDAQVLLAQLDAERTAAFGELNALRRAELLTLLGGAALAVVVAAGILLLLRRWVTRPIAKLAGDARLVADGQHEHQVAVPSGPPELSAVAADVERMRSRIVSELAHLAASQRELREIKDRLQRQTVDLMRSNRDLEQFAYVASHDLQEPLRKVAGFCQLLARRYGDQLDERGAQYIEFAVDGAQRMQRLINELLAFSRVGRGEAVLVNVSLADVVAGALTDLEEARDAANAEVIVGELPVVLGDASLLRQLMTNLIGNSIKFHRPDVPPEVRIEANRSGNHWEISVADNGIGISPEFADKIFVLFGRLHARDSYSGTGIGLALAKRIVEHHGGQIWLDTEHSNGATIRFTLPAGKESP